MASSSTTSDQPEREPTHTSGTGFTPENVVMGAFDEIAPSASTSTLIRKPAYDVFINHRGPDVGNTLAIRIYSILREMKVTAFLDSVELDYGDFLPTTIEAAIRGATLHISIFSENFAESSWCLAQLSYMLKSGATLIPIYYFVDPIDLRYVFLGKGRYSEAFRMHEEKGRYSPEKLLEWKTALHRVSLYTGQIIQNNDDETRLLKNIVNVVLKEIRNVPLVVAKHPIGLYEMVKDFEDTFPLFEGDQGVQIVGIWGMGGSGKTTLAKELYNRRSSFVERSSFIFDIREAKDMLQKKQIQLVEDLGVNQIFDNVEQGKIILAKRLRSNKVLVVMDNVDHADQLDALLPEKETLGMGSLIIVTTREYEVLTSWGISSIYKMKALDPFDAQQLFCWHAFSQPFPINGFEKLVKNFVEACHGLPLSLKIFGRQLYGNSNKQYWESLLHRISRLLPKDIKHKLKISYDGLDDEEKETFLDTACFLIGEKISLAIEIWKGSEWSGLYNWIRLLNKCLVELDNDNNIKMHPHLRDMGREIADQHLPWRVWSPQQIINAQTVKRNHIRGIKAVPTEIGESSSYGKEYVVRERILAPSLVGLKLLVIRGDYSNQVIGDVSKELLWLRWYQIGQRNLPARLSLQKLRVLELYEDHGGEHHLEELWEADSDPLLQLRELVISDCPKFQRFPNSIGRLFHLRRIVITDGNNVSSLPEEFCCLKSLEHLQLCDCVMLLSLPSKFGNLESLRHLDLSSCKNLKSLPASFNYLMLLEYLNLQGCGQLTLKSEDFRNITKLEFLSLSWCEQSKELPRHITNQASLSKLYLNSMKQLRELPLNIGQLSKLQKMSIGSELLKSLPNSLGGLSSLTNLSIECCPELVILPGSLGDLSFLIDLSIQNCHKLKCLPDSLGNLFSLTNLSIEYCPKLIILPDSLGKLISLTNLSIKYCLKLIILPDSLGDLRSLTNLSIEDCPDLVILPDSLGDLSSLTDLSIQNCHSLKRLPDSLRYLSSLTGLSIQNCRNLEYCPNSLENLSSLTNLKIMNCPKLSPDSSEQLTNLEKPNISGCKTLSSLPAESDNLTSWLDINLNSDIQLSMLPAGSKQSLQVSYYELDEEEREMFLDTACFLIGEKKSRAVAVWDGSGWSGLRGLETIQNKCLVELVDDPDYDGEKIIRMHDHIRDMGRKIASRQSPYRIWSPEQIINMKKHSMERKLIRGILAAGAFVELKEHMHQSMVKSSRQSLSTGLQILSVEGNEFTEELASLSENLVWLRWESFPRRNLPSWLQLQILRVLELHGANELEELWQEQEHVPSQLRELIISGTWSASFERFPSSISKLSHLNKISLLGDAGKEFGIKGLPEEFCDLQSLEHLELRHCILLSSLPARFGDLRNLRHLDLCSCKALRMLPVSFQQLTLLNYLDLSGCKRLLLQKDILENITKLKKLNLSGCLALQKLPHQISDQACLRELQLQHTHLEDLPSNIGQLSKLEVLTIGSPLLKCLPDSLGNLSSLKSLSITDCFALECLPKTFGNLGLLEHLCIEATGMRSLPEGFTQLASLRTLKISDCPLSELDFGSVSSFSLENLTEINLSDTLVTRISISEHCCPRLETLQLSKNDKLEVVEDLPATVKKRKLPERETLDIKGIRALRIPLKLTISDCP